MNLRAQLEENKKALQAKFNEQQLANSSLSVRKSKDDQPDSLIQSTDGKTVTKGSWLTQFIAVLLASPESNHQSTQNQTIITPRTLTKKPLEIDTEAINLQHFGDENQKQKSVEPTPVSSKSEILESSLNLSQMRLVMGSEQIVRENSTKVFCQPGFFSPQ